MGQAAGSNRASFIKHFEPSRPVGEVYDILPALLTATPDVLSWLKVDGLQ